MNAATYTRAGLAREELDALLDLDEARWPALGDRTALAARYARALSRTPVTLDATLVEELRVAFSAREVVTLATTIAQVNFWSRFNQGLGVPSAGFFVEEACARE